MEGREESIDDILIKIKNLEPGDIAEYQTMLEDKYGVMADGNLTNNENKVNLILESFKKFLKHEDKMQSQNLTEIDPTLEAKIILISNILKTAERQEKNASLKDKILAFSKFVNIHNEQIKPLLEAPPRSTLSPPVPVKIKGSLLELSKQVEDLHSKESQETNKKESQEGGKLQRKTSFKDLTTQTGRFISRRLSSSKIEPVEKPLQRTDSKSNLLSRRDSSKNISKGSEEKKSEEKQPSSPKGKM